MHGDTALVSINNISEFPLSSIQLEIMGYQNSLELIDIVTDESTAFGQLDWVTVYNDTETLLITASAGATAELLAEHFSN